MQYQFDDFYFIMNDIIGKGASGDVYKCKLKSDNTKEFVIKVVSGKINDKELNILKKLMNTAFTNENVVKVYAIEKKQNSLYIVMEYCQSDLQQIIQKRNQPFSQEEALTIIQQIANGYKICLQNQIIHRDIKPANILVTDNNIYKLADFGEGKIFENNINSFQNQTLVGSPAYSSPQIYLAEEDKAKATNKLDIFSLGIIFFQLLSNSLPFIPCDDKNLEIFHNKLKNNSFQLQNYIPNLRNDIAELLMSMLQFHEKQRIGWHEFLSHKLINNPIIQVPMKKSIITLKSTFFYTQNEQNEIIEMFEKKQNELHFLNDFSQIPTSQGFDILRSYLIQNRYTLMNQLPYNADKIYYTDYIKLVFVFYKLIRNEQIEFEQLNNLNILKEYLKN